MEMNQEYSFKKIMITLIIIILIILAFYGITIFITQKQKEKEKENTNTEIQYSEILIGNMYQKKEEEYYVLVQLESDYSKLYTSAYNYQQKGDIKLYTANLDNAMNKKYLSEESDFNKRFPTYKESTLLKIKDGNIIEYYEGTDAILKVIGS